MNVVVADEEPSAISEDMERQARKSKKCRYPCYHISISPHERDAASLSDEQWNRIASEFLEDSGLGDRQAVAFLHEDEDYPKSGNPRPHLHLIANRIGDDGKAYDTSWDFYRFQSVLRGLEERHGLVRQHSSWEVARSRNSCEQIQRLQREEREYNRGDRNQPPQPTAKTQIQSAIDESYRNSTSTKGIRNYLSTAGIEVDFDEKGATFEKDGVRFAGYQLGRNYTLPAIQANLGSKAQQSDDGNWQVATNELNDKEKSSIVSLPQTEEDYQVQVSGKSVVYGLSNLAPEDMKRDRDSHVRWKGENDRFDYSFSVGSEDESGRQPITGYDNQSESNNPVFEASIDQKGFIRTDRCDIPSVQLDRLVEQVKQQKQRQRSKQRSKQQKQRQRSKQRSKNMEL
jgi:hypothetical protein